jgi:hypothetical protein
MTPDDAQGTPETRESAVTPAPESTQSQTAEGTKEAAEEFNPDELPEDKRARLLKWADTRAAHYHRQEITKAGNKLIRVPDEIKEKLRQDPDYVTKLEQERDAFRRAALTGGGGSANGKSVVEEKKPEDTDTSEQDAKEFLQEAGWTQADEDYPRLLRAKTLEFKFIAKKFKGRAPAPSVDVEKVVSEKLTANEKARRDAEATRHWQAIQASPEYNHPEKGFEFRGRLAAKMEELQANGNIADYTLKDIADLVKQEMSPKAAARAKVSMGESSSGKVAASAGSDPWANFKAECKAQGIRPEDF